MTMQGLVVSDKMDKTVVVKVTIHKRHPKYHKAFSINKKYKAHDQNNEYHVGDMVEIESMNPLSREKTWRVARKLK